VLEAASAASLGLSVKISRDHLLKGCDCEALREPVEHGSRVGEVE